MGFKAIIIIRKQFLRQTQCIQLRLKCLHLSSWFFSSSQKLYKNRYHYHYLTDRSRSQWGDQPVLAASGSGHMAQPGLWLFRTRYCLCGECGSKDRTLGSSPFFSFYPIPRASPQGEESLFKIGFIRGSLGRHRSTQSNTKEEKEQAWGGHPLLLSGRFWATHRKPQCLTCKIKHWTKCMVLTPLCPIKSPVKFKKICHCLWCGEHRQKKCR